MYGMTESYASEMGLEMVLAIFGNAFLMLIIIRGNAVSKRKVSPVQLLLLHTCVADLLFAFLAMGTGIVELEVLYKYDFSEWVCPVMKFLQVFPLYASPFLLVAISADRFQAICRPLAHYRASKYRMPNLLAAIAWSLAFICSIPQCYIWEKGTIVTSDGNITCCHTVFSRRTHSGTSVKVKKFWYIVCFNAVAWLLPSIIASILYYRVCRAVWSSRVTDPLQEVTHQQQQQRTSITALKSIQTRCYVDGLRKSTLRRQISEFDKKRMQTVRLTLTIVVCNFLLYAPYCIGNVINALNEGLIGIKLLTYCMILGNLNSCVNPWIYIFFNKGHVKRALCLTGGLPSKPNNSNFLLFLTT
uniref:G_PROTEIN_RECEP_F1_2 domain-containing protein n=1 Tax=Syphacia muris TaxID=451379 RepID=A0A0N5AFU9_9BILA